MAAEFEPQPPSQSQQNTCTPTPTTTKRPTTDSKRASRGQTVEAYEESVRPAAEPFVPMCPTTRARSTTPLPADKVTKALDAIDRLGHALALQRELVSLNYLDNIRRYLLATGADGALAMSRTSFASMALKATVKTLATFHPKNAMEAGLGRLLGTLSTGTKLVGGFVLGLVYDVLVDVIFDPTGKALRKAFKAGHEAGVQDMAGFAQATVKSRLEAYGKDSMLLAELRSQATLAPSSEFLDGLAQWLDGQIPPLCLPVVDDSLYQNLLETWVLQRAGDEEDANKHTDSDTYDKAHDKLAPTGNLARRDLFIHQARFELGRLGVDAEPTLALWQTLLDAQPDANPARTLAALGPLRVDTTRFASPDRFIRTVRDTDGRKAFLYSPSQEVYDTDEAGWLSTHPKPEHDALRDRVRYSNMDQALERSRALLDMLRSGGLRLSVEVDVSEDDGAIFVDQYRYTLAGTRGGGHDSHHPQELAVRRTEWTDSPI